MDVAIIGAGVAGLACAKELNRFGIIPTVYEKRNKMDISYMHSMAVLNIYHNNRDALDILKRKYDVDIKPLGPIKCIETYSAHKSAAIKGNLGYYFLRGEAEKSVINQISRGINAKINYNMTVDIEKIKDKFDYVVVATGEESIPKRLNLWEEIIATWTRGSIVIGDLPENTLRVWLGTPDVGSGYACQVPIDTHKACIFLILPYSNKEEAEYHWEKFLFSNRIEYHILYNFEQRLNAGLLSKHTMENILFVGNSGGFLDPLLGSGFFNAVATGTLAARALVGKLNYERAIMPYQKQQEYLSTLRSAYDKLQYKDLDKIVAAMGTYPVKNLIYSQHMDEFKLLSLLVRLFDDSGD